MTTFTAQHFSFRTNMVLHKSNSLSPLDFFQLFPLKYHCQHYHPSEMHPNQNNQLHFTFEPPTWNAKLIQDREKKRSARDALRPKTEARWKFSKK